MGTERPSGELVQGTLDMLILRTLARGPSHGWGIAQHIRRMSDEVLRVEEGSLYPALHRLELTGELAAEWGVPVNNRRARIYRLTTRGHRRLGGELERWDMLVGAMARVLGPA